MCPGRVAKTHVNLTSVLKPASDVLDTDRDGKISADDLRSFYETFSKNSILDGGMIDSMISAADLDKKGFVEYEEFERVIRPEKNIGHEALKDAFKVMDSDGDGKVGCDDLRMYFRMVGMKVSEEEIFSMVRLGCCGDDGGGVGFDGFRKILGFDD